MTRDAWLTKRPYLQGIAALQDLIDITVKEASIPSVAVPLLDGYIDEFRAGIPLLLSPTVTIDVRPAEKAFATIVQTLAATPLPKKLSCEVLNLVADLRSDAGFPHRAIAWLLGRDSLTPGHPGVLRFLGWTVMARYLNPLVNGFARWRDEEYWLRNYCPMCGASPAMGQIVHSDSANLRFLSCGCCGSRWRYPRTRCAFCESQDDRTMAVLAIEGENALQIAYCDSCKGYLKTCSGDESEPFLLADWTSLHLDVIALDRGLKRFAESRYQMPSFGIPQPLAS